MKKRIRSLLIFALICHVSFLGYFKYCDFFLSNINLFFGLKLPLQDIVLPLAISFFTFQQIAYLVDVYQKKIVRQNLLDYSLFVSFFAQLIAGPIVHHKDIMPQLQFASKFSLEKIQKGISYFSIGLFNKVIIADTLATFVDPAFLAAEQAYHLTFVEAWGAVFAYSFQIYYDFSAYCLMAIGLGFLFHIELVENFDQPYQARNIKDFWKKWHMTLSQFLKNYLYIPMGGNRVSVFRNKVNLMITMMIGGLWHGAHWNFILWGALHGFYLLVFSVYNKLSKKKLPKLLAQMITFMVVSLTWILFRSNDLSSAYNIFSSLSIFQGIELDQRSIEKFSLDFSWVHPRSSPLPYFSFYQFYCLILVSLLT
ncbi:MBOAT family protein, partial [bacterium]|nr:MBOAT family protein [bacterium]